MKPWERYQSPSKGGPWERYQVSFEKAVQGVLESEGGYANDPVDRGGETKYGISKKAYPDLDIAALTREQAVEIYRRDYWEAIGADQLPNDVREAAFDAAVNQGPEFARKALKESGGQLVPFLEARRQRYESIVSSDPSQKKFSKGWMNRLDKFTPEGPWKNYRGQ